MGWRYRKRIKILPGIHINISKSGISTNVGIKGASVTLGSDGTYVNTGIPGSGLYRRDKINSNDKPQQYSEYCDTSEKNPFVTWCELNKRAKVLPFVPPLYFLYLLSSISSFIGFCIFCLGYLNILACCLIVGLVQITSFVVINNYYTSAYDKLSKEEKRQLRKEIRNHPNREIKAHTFGRNISTYIAISNLLPLLSISRGFIGTINSAFDIYQEASSIAILFFPLMLLIVWISLFVTENEQIKSLRIRMKAISANESKTVIEEDTVPVLESNMKESELDDIKQCSENEVVNDTIGIDATGTILDRENTQDSDSDIIVENVNKKSENDNNDLSNYGNIDTPYDPKRDLENYHYPTLDLLMKYENDGLPFINMEEQNANKNRIVDTLRNFGVEISSIKATVGPRFTLYEITPALGVNVYKIRGLEDDLALWLGTQGIRIIAPIPGKGTVGIEVPNMKVSIAPIESILNSKKFQESTMELPCALGKTITNEVFMFDLTKAPHVLIAGSTGQGKSVAINSILTSLLYKKHPAELKLVLMDPCVIELGVYEMIEKHFLAALCDEPSVVINSHQAVSTLNSLCREMDVRYDLLKMAFARNIKEYNRKFIDRQLNPEIGHKFMPYIVVIIDEYANFISETGKEFELPLARLAQLARAVGIHMIISTKRPTNDIITGTIKSNFSTRISFRVPESVDSRVILDREGAERLLGNGDMLYVNGGEPVRVQCAYIDTLETERICQFISQQQGYISPFELPDPYFDENEYGGESRDVDMQHLDPMFEDAAHLIVREQSGSTSLIQREFAIGYNRAGRLMDQLEKAGIVGAAHGSKPREVLIMDDTSLENLLSQWE